MKNSSSGVCLDPPVRDLITPPRTRTPPRTPRSRHPPPRQSRARPPRIPSLAAASSPILPPDTNLSEPSSTTPEPIHTYTFRPFRSKYTPDDSKSSPSYMSYSTRLGHSCKVGPSPRASPPRSRREGEWSIFDGDWSIGSDSDRPTPSRPSLPAPSSPSPPIPSDDGLAVSSRDGGSERCRARFPEVRLPGD